MDRYDQEQADKTILRRFELLQGEGQVGNMLDRWIERLDHHRATGSPTTLSAERTTELRDLLMAVRDYIDRALTIDDEPMSEQAWEVAGGSDLGDPDDPRAGTPTGIGTLHD